MFYDTKSSRPFAGPGHVTYPPLDLRPDTVNTSENKRARQNKYKFEVCSIEYKIWKQFKS